MSFLRNFRESRRGGIALDLVIAFGVVLVGAFLLYGVGVTFHSLLHSAERFFGL